MDALHAWLKAVKRAKHNRWLIRKALERHMQSLIARAFADWDWWTRHCRIMANLLGMAKDNVARGKCRRILQVQWLISLE